MAGRGWGTGVLGPVVAFSIQRHPDPAVIEKREDGISIDQIVISPSLYFTPRLGH